MAFIEAINYLVYQVRKYDYFRDTSSNCQAVLTSTRSVIGYYLQNIQNNSKPY